MAKKTDRAAAAAAGSRLLVTPLADANMDVEAQRQVPIAPNHRNAALQRAERKYGAKVLDGNRGQWRLIMQRLLQRA